MKQKELEKVAIFIAIFLGFAAIMYGTSFGILYNSLSVLVLLIFLYLTHRFIIFFPKIGIQVREWQNRERKTNFHISDISESTFNEKLFFVIVSFPKPAFWFVKITFKIGLQGKEIVEKDVQIPSFISGLSDTTYKFTQELSSPVNKLLWRSNLDECVKIYENSIDFIDLFKINSDGTFSFFSPSESAKELFFWRKYGIKEHDFIVEVSGRDFFGRLFVQRAVMKIKYDGKIIKTERLINSDEA
jgi:hypothetical protein